MSTDLDRKDLRPCAICGKGLMHRGSPVFYRLSIQPMCMDLASVREHAGLETMLGSPAIAAAFSSRPAIAKAVGDPTEGLVCQPCALESADPLLVMEERIRTASDRSAQR